MLKNRVALFAHFDARNEVKSYVLSYLKALRQECQKVLFVSTAALPEAELAKLSGVCQLTLLRENVGWDFCMWKEALGVTDLTNVDELVLANSSTFGPVFPLAPIFERMSEAPCDFWGMTDNFEIAWHLQSYFLVFKRSALSSPAFKDFFASVLPYRDKDQVIRSYEVGLTRFLEEHHLVPAAFAPAGAWESSEWKRRLARKRKRNSTVYHPLALLKLGMPLVKVQLLRDNPARVRLKPVLRAMEQLGYDMSQIEY
jgi:lipopolysaccharide biosynthesis protein